MPRRMPRLLGQLEAAIDKALAIAQAGEIIRAQLPAGSKVRRELGPSRLEALNELAYLRIFIAWESFLEDSFLHYLCAFENSSGPLALLKPRFHTLDDARKDMLQGSDFVSWYSPTKIVKRSQRYANRGPHELVIVSSQARLEWFAAIRGRIAHSSRHARDEFDKATLGLVGRRIRGGNSGLFLRSPEVNSGERWLVAIAAELKNLAAQITP